MAKVAYAMGPDLPGSLLFRAEDLARARACFVLVDPPPPRGRMQDLPNGGGGGAAPSIGPRALETLATPLHIGPCHITPNGKVGGGVNQGVESGLLTQVRTETEDRDRERNREGRQ